MTIEEGPAGNSIPIKRPLEKRLLKWLIRLLGLILLLILIPLGLILAYEKEIKDAVVEELNSHLNTQVYINPDNIDITFLRTFPNAAIRFTDVSVMGSLEELPNDTLLHARTIYLLFNIRDIWNEKYTIEKIGVQGASLNLRASNTGEINYDIWKKEPKTSKSKGKTADFRLSSVAFSEFMLSYRNAQRKLKLNITLNNASFAGNFSEDSYTLDIRANGKLEQLRSENKTYLKDKKLNLELTAQVRKNTYTVTKAEVGLNKLFFTATGVLTDNGEELPAEIHFKGKNIDVQSVFSLLPQKFHDKISDYSNEGIFYADIAVNGNLYDYNTLDIQAGFGTSTASITHNPTKTKLHDVSFTGSFRKKKFSPEALEIKDVKASQGNNFVSGDFSISNFDSPYLKLNAKGNYNLADFLLLVPVDTISSASGLIDFEVSANINMNDARAKQIGTSSAKGRIELKQVQIAFKMPEGKDKVLEIPGGQIFVDNENLETRELKVVHGKSSLELSGKAQNFLNYLLKPEQPLSLTLEVKSPFIDVDDFILPSQPTAAASKEENPFNLHDNFAADLDLQVNEVVFRQFKAKDFQGKLEIRNKKMLAKNFSFEAFNGDITLTGVANVSKPGRLEITGSTSLVDVNMQQLFSQLNNFGQQVIEDKNLNGKATAHIDFSAAWNNQLQCILPEIVASADLSIMQGELVDYKTLEYLSEYVKIEELKRVKFATLQTHVDIKNQAIYISKTQVKNSALDIELYGSQTFDYAIDYHIKLRLSDWLAKRPGKSKEMEEELNEAENDPENKRCVFIKMTGTVDKPVISYDRKAMKQKIKQDIKEEKNTLKKMLNEEFGWFKKDSASFRKDDRKQDQKFKIDFNQEKKEKKKEEADDGDF
jgi:hypothetical protein